MEKSSSKSRLVEEVRYELEQLKKLASAARELAEYPSSERRSWDSAAAAKYVSDLCAGLENLCKRRSIYLGLPRPGGPDSHTQSLKEFLETPDLGGRLDPEVAQRLKKYLRFRHRFIHGYGFQVVWELVDEPLRQLPETVSALASIWEDWLKSLPM